MEEINKLLTNYLSSLKKLYYGVKLLIEQKNIDNDIKTKYANHLRNMVYNYNTLIQKGIPIPDVRSFEHQEFSIIDGILYGKIDVARKYADTNYNSQSIDTCIVPTYIKYCILKEERSYIPYPLNNAQTEAQKETIKTRSNPLDIFSRFNNVIINN